VTGPGGECAPGTITGEIGKGYAKYYGNYCDKDHARHQRSRRKL